MSLASIWLETSGSKYSFDQLFIKTNALFTYMVLGKYASVSKVQTLDYQISKLGQVRGRTINLFLPSLKAFNCYTVLSAQ